MRCPVCGKDNREGTKFCRGCGNQLLKPPGFVPPKPSDPDPEPKKSSGALKWIIAAIVVLLVAIIGLGAYLFITWYNENHPIDSDRDRSSQSSTINKKATSATAASDGSDPSQSATDATASEKPSETQSASSSLKVPNLVGMKSSDAFSKLSDLGLKHKAEFEYSESVPQDYVISQLPAEDKSIQAGDTVTLTISRGAEPKNTTQTQTPTSTSTGTVYKDSMDMYDLRASSRYLTTNDIKGMSLEQIQRAINELYAKHGFKFTSGDDKKYFESLDWYHPDTTDMNVVAGRMNKYEEANLKVMGQYRNSLK